MRGFDVHASVRVAADDDVGREKLVRYCARPPFALEGLTVLADGRVAYRVKYPRGNATHRLMTPVELLARIAALIPPPRYPLVRYHGILAPHAKLRAAVVPRVPAAGARGGTSSEPSTPPGASGTTPSAALEIGERARVASVHAGKTRSRGIADCEAWRVSPSPGERPLNELSRKHLARLAGGTLLAATPRIDWARLLRRTFEVDVLSCPSCGGRLRLIAEITDPAVISKILEHLDEPTSGPPLARARAPDDEPDAYADA